MKEIIASAVAAGTLVVAWVCFVVLTTYGGLWRILEGSFFIGVPAAFGAAVIAACAQVLARRVGWPLAIACAFCGLAISTILGAGFAASVDDWTVTSANRVELIARFAGLGVALGIFVFGVLWIMRSNARSA